MFRVYGVVSLIVLGGFIMVNFYRPDTGFQHDLPPEEDPRMMAEEGTALAPHGVPANPLPRAHSSHKLHDNQNGYGTYPTNQPQLDVPGNMPQSSYNLHIGNFMHFVVASCLLFINEVDLLVYERKVNRSFDLIKNNCKGTTVSYSR